MTTAAGAPEGGAVLAIHAGAGGVSRKSLGEEGAAAARAALAHCLERGREVLADGGSALDAVELAVSILEDEPRFNAGRGSVLNSAGGIEMDAALMDGQTRAAGAVAAVSRLVNPVRAARIVLEHGQHVLLVGPAAEAFTAERGAALAERDYFTTSAREAQLERAREKAQIELDHDGSTGTVGAVARDRDGHLAAATSTGGVVNKLPGRVGDSPLIGAGTWADDATCAVSGTGRGEAFIRAALAHEVDALMRYRKASLRRACKRALDRVVEVGGRGGCIAVDREGNVELPFTTRGMYRGWARVEGPIHVALFKRD